MDNSYKKNISEFETIGENELRYRMAHGSFFGNRALAGEWLLQKEEERAAALSLQRDSREAEMLKIAQKTSSNAFLAKIAAIIAAIAAIVGTIANIISILVKSSSS